MFMVKDSFLLRRLCSNNVVLVVLMVGDSFLLKSFWLKDVLMMEDGFLLKTFYPIIDLKLRASY